MTQEDLIARCEALGLPYAPIGRPEDLDGDPHLRESGGLVPVTLDDEQTAMAPALPLSFDGARPVPRYDLPKLGEHSDAIAAELGFSPAEIAAFHRDGVLD